MMNKKYFLLFIILIFVIAGGWWKSHSGNSANQNSLTANNSDSTKRRSGAEILANDQMVLEKNLSPETLNDKNWEQVNDYTLSAKNLVTKDNARELFKLTQVSAKDLAFCLKKDFCGMEKRNDDDSYFDENKTPGHILLARNLEILQESLRKDNHLKRELNFDLLRSLTESENEKIQVIVLELLKDYDAGTADAGKLLEIADNYKGNAKANAFEKIAAIENAGDRSLLISSIEKSFMQDDPNTVISIVEKIKKMNLNEREIEKISQSLCHFKENGADDPNWKMIKYNMKKVIELDKVCN